MGLAERVAAEALWWRGEDSSADRAVAVAPLLAVGLDGRVEDPGAEDVADVVDLPQSAAVAERVHVREDGRERGAVARAPRLQA